MTCIITSTGSIFMQIKCTAMLLTFVFLTTTFVPSLSAQAIIKNQTGVQGDYHYEYWMDYGYADTSGIMQLGDGGNFSCSWDSVNNILFKKGMMPGRRDQLIFYSVDYNPMGNSYLGAYGWTEDPLVEYYIIDSWGAWKPPGGTSIGTVLSDGGLYDIYVSYPGMSIPSQKRFWSVRQTKRTSGTITCAKHFDAWAAKNMVMGDLCEVMFFVEAYQSSGTADITMSMYPGITAINDKLHISQSRNAQSDVFGISIQPVFTGGRQTLPFGSSQNRNAVQKVYNLLGQKFYTISGKDLLTGKSGVIVNRNSTVKSER